MSSMQCNEHTPGFYFSHTTVVILSHLAASLPGWLDAFCSDNAYATILSDNKKSSADRQRKNMYPRKVYYTYWKE